MKMWYIDNMEYYLAINKNQIMKISGKLQDLENILSKIIQIKKLLHVLPHVKAPAYNINYVCKQFLVDIAV